MKKEKSISIADSKTDKTISPKQLEEITSSGGFFGSRVIGASSWSTSSGYDDPYCSPYDVEKHKKPDHEYHPVVGVRSTNKRTAHNWLTNGKGDEMAALQLELYRKSKDHKSAVDTKTNLTYGAGFEFSIPDVICFKDEFGKHQEVEVNLSDSEKEELLKQARLKWKDWNGDDFHRRASFDLNLHGGYYRNTNYYLEATGNPSVDFISLQKYCNARLSTNRIYHDGENSSEKIYISKHFKTAKKYQSFDEYDGGILSSKNTFTSLDLDKGQAYENNEPGTFCKPVGNITSYRDYYPTADYESESFVKLAMMDFMLDCFEYGRVKDGFNLETIIIRYRPKKINDKQEAEEKAKDIRDLMQHKGPEGRQCRVMWVEPTRNVDTGVIENVRPFEFFTVEHDKNPKRHAQAKEAKKAGILSLHGIILEEIIGAKSSSGRGLSSEAQAMIVAIEHLYFNRIKKLQSIIEKDIESIFIAEGFPVKVTTKQSKPSLERMAQALMSQVMSKDEIRSHFGMSAMTEEVAKELNKSLVREGEAVEGGG